MYVYKVRNKSACKCMTNNLSRYSLGRACRKLIAWYFCKHVPSTGRLPRGQWQMKSFIRSIHEPPFRQGCDQQSSTFSEQVLPAGTDRNIQTQFNVMEEHWLFFLVKSQTKKKPKRAAVTMDTMIGVCEALMRHWQTDVAQISLYFPNNEQHLFYCTRDFYFTRQLITSNLTSMKRDWVITRLA